MEIKSCSNSRDVGTIKKLWSADEEKTTAHGLQLAFGVNICYLQDTNDCVSLNSTTIKSQHNKCHCKNVLAVVGKTVHPQKSTIYNFGNKYFTIINNAIADFPCNMAEACACSHRGRMDFFLFLALTSS